MRALYTIDNTTAQVRYAGNGVTTAFSVTFQFFEASTLRVRTAIADAVTLKVLNTDYTVSGGAGATGTVTFGTAPPTGTNVIIDLSIPMLQETVDLAPNGPLPAEDVEQGFDRIVTMVKQLRQQLLSVPELDATFNPDTDQPPILPPPVNGKVLIGREDETGWENADTFEPGTTLPVLTSSLANQDLIEYDSAGVVWRNRTLQTILGRLLTTRGDILLRGASTISRLALGAANRFLKSNGTDLAYGQVDLASGDVTGVLARANGGFTPTEAENVLGANVPMGATGTFYTGPTITLGTGKWFVSGFVTVQNTVGGDTVNVRMWDGGSKFIGSTRVHLVSVAGTYFAQAHFSGFVTDPAGAVRISVSPISRTDGAIAYNASGASNDSRISAFRVS